MRTRSLVLLTVVLMLVIIFGAGVWLIRGGFSAREKPSAVEALVARSVRNVSIPASAKNANNPFPATPEILQEARAHFADHCAICHANNGSGETAIGKNLYPKAPDLRQPDIQKLTDGQIYYIIHNGIRLTGMPAWGEADKDEDSWKLVHFIRHLPQLTLAEEKEMEALNPKSPEEFREEQEEEQFLKGQAPAPKKHTEPHH
jgi:mono/diheme cytochrome c family protein